MSGGWGGGAAAGGYVHLWHLQCESGGASSWALDLAKDADIIVEWVGQAPAPDASASYQMFLDGVEIRLRPGVLGMWDAFENAPAGFAWHAMPSTWAALGVSAGPHTLELMRSADGMGDDWTDYGISQSTRAQVVVAAVAAGSVTEIWQGGT